MDDNIEIRDNEELLRKNKELESLVQYLRSVIETKDTRIAELEQEYRKQTKSAHEQLLEFKQQQLQQIQQLNNQIITLTQENEKLQNDYELAMNSRSENALLKQQLNELQNQANALKLRHQEELFQTREQVTQTRANLAAEFHIQLEQGLRDRVREALVQLPQQARQALGEKEVLKLQLHQQSIELQDIVVENHNLQQKLRDLQNENESNQEVKDVIMKKQIQLKRQIERLEEDNKKLQEENQALQINNVSITELKKSQQQAIKEKEEIKLQCERQAKQIQMLTKGLEKVCARYNLQVKQFYIDPYQVVQTKTELPSITTQRGRFMVPDL